MLWASKPDAAVYTASRVAEHICGMRSNECPYGAGAIRQRQSLSDDGRRKRQFLRAARVGDSRGMQRAALSRAQAAQCFLALVRHYDTHGPLQPYPSVTGGPGRIVAWHGLRDVGVDDATAELLPSL
eukprot:gene59-5631_t